jgi:hypothetical protein
LLFDGEQSAIPDHHRSSVLSGTPVEFNDRRAVIYKSHSRVLPERIGDQPVSHIGAIHIVRHPLDVFLSWLNFLSIEKSEVAQGDLRPGGWPFEAPRKPVDRLVADGELWIYLGLFLAYGTLLPRFSATGSWLEHTNAWFDRGQDMPVIRLRYEELVQKGAPEFRALAEAFRKGLSQSDAAYLAANNSTKRDGKFFWRQVPYGYRDVIPEEYLSKVRALFGPRFEQFGYAV